MVLAGMVLVGAAQAQQASPPVVDTVPAADTAADPAVRYGLVTAVNDGLLAGEGTYATQVGVYTLNCTRADNVATLTFENTLAATPEPQATPDGTAPEEEGVNEEEGSLAG